MFQYITKSRNKLCDLQISTRKKTQIKECLDDLEASFRGDLSSEDGCVCLSHDGLLSNPGVYPVSLRLRQFGASFLSYLRNYALGSNNCILVAEC